MWFKRSTRGTEKIQGKYKKRHRGKVRVEVFTSQKPKDQKRENSRVDNHIEVDIVKDLEVVIESEPR